MVCNNCRRAGKFNALANQQAGEPTERVLRRSAEGWHEICTDIVCTCQHVTGRVLLRDTEYEPTLNPDFGSSDQ